MTNPAKILLISSMFAHFAFEMLGPIYAIFVKDIGGDILDAGAAIVTSYSFTALFITMTLFNIPALIIIIRILKRQN